MIVAVVKSQESNDNFLLSECLRQREVLSAECCVLSVYGRR